MHLRSNTWRARKRVLCDFAREVWSRVGEDRLTLPAAAVAFYLMLSMIPLGLLLVTLATYVLPHEAVRSLLIDLAAVLGPQLSAAIQTEIITVVRDRGVLTGVALLLGFWIGSQVFVTLELAMNQVWRAHRRRPYWISRLIALLMLMVVGLFLLAAIALANLIRVLAQLQWPLWGWEVTALPWLFGVVVSVIIPLLLVTAIFAAAFRLLPARPVTLHSVLPGAIFAGVAWIVFLHLFGWYLAHVANYSVLYGSLGGLILLMIWFYYSAFIMLVGAEIAAVYHQRLLTVGDREEQRVEEKEQE